MIEGIVKWIKTRKTKSNGWVLPEVGHVPHPPPPRAVASTKRLKLEKKAREENPAVKDAWEKYQITLKLVIGDEEEPKKFGKRTYNTGPK